MSDQRADLQAEIAVLAACMETKTARAEARKHLTGSDFYDPRHETIWHVMGTLDREGKPVDHLTVQSALTGNAALLMPEIVTTLAFPDNVASYAGTVRGWATKRRVEDALIGFTQKVRSPEYDGNGLATEVANAFAALRDSSIDEDVTGLTVTELLAQADDEPDWLIPDLLERRDRFMLTGEEGLGKSHLLRQFAIHAAAGLNPFDMGATFVPLRCTIIDCENTWNQVRRKIRPAVEWAARHGQDPSDRVIVDCTTRMDITRDKDLARIHQLLDAQQPDLVVIGPLYRLVPRAIQTDDDAAPILAALDTIRDRGCALLMEAHAGHAIGKGGVRDLRPRGSSALLGWPEFGYGMRHIGTDGYADLVQWRGPREDREFPQRLRKADGFRWLPHHDLYGWNQGGVA